MRVRSADSTRRLAVRFGWLVPVLFYGATMSRTMGYVDAALVLNNASVLHVSAWVNSHNLFSLLGWLWMKAVPFGSPFFRLNLFSMLCGAFTVYVVFRACLEYAGSLGAAAVAAVALMTSHSLWWHSTMLEVYTLNSLLLALIIFALARYYAGGRRNWLYASLLFWGLGMSNHVLMALLAPAFVVLVILERKSLTLADAFIGLGCLAAGLSLLIVALARSYGQYGSLLAVLHMMTGGEFKTLMFNGQSALFWRLNYAGLLVYQFPSLALICLGAGLFRLVADHRRMDLLLIAATAPMVLWSASYFVWDMFAFALPAYVLLAFAVARGFAALRHRRTLLVLAAVSLVAPLVLYSVLPRTATVRDYVRSYEMSAMVEDAFDPAQYFLSPVRTGFDEVESHVEAIERTLPQGAWYFDNVYDFPIALYYQPVLGRLKEINCPQTFVFWVTEDEMERVARRINRLVAGGAPVYINRFVLETVGDRLVGARAEPLAIGDYVIYRVR